MKSDICMYCWGKKHAFFRWDNKHVPAIFSHVQYQFQCVLETVYTVTCATSSLSVLGWAVFLRSLVSKCSWYWWCFFGVMSICMCFAQFHCHEISGPPHELHKAESWGFEELKIKMVLHKHVFSGIAFGVWSKRNNLSTRNSDSCSCWWQHHGQQGGSKSSGALRVREAGSNKALWAEIKKNVGRAKEKKHSFLY